MTILINVIGWIAVALGASMYAPQTFKVLKARSAKGLSKFTFTIAAFGNGMWLMYMGSLGKFPDTASGWAVNALVGIMMLPILYHIYRDKFTFRVIAYLWFMFAFTLSLYWDIHNAPLPVAVQIIFVCLAGATTSFGFVPQIIKIKKTKSIGNLSLLLVALYGLVNALWTIYWIFMVQEADGHARDSMWISIVLDGIGFVVQFYLAYLIITYRKKHPIVTSRPE